ncbi:histidinol-phosphatase [Gilvimarinus sp. F26214L]|uniref:histidinol-phosphatase n=1 Tax=Gilvimarinus sp. DZF01 TaxID=3461371 RepID=UPI004046314E
MSLVLFDLDNTLIAGDSDHLWGEFLVEQAVVDAADYRARNDEFYRAYQRGELDIQAYLAFALAPLSRFSGTELRELHRQFMRDKIEALRLDKAQALIGRHQANGDVLAIITSTNRFVTEPIATMLGIEHLMATELEMDGDRYTGRIVGVPCYRAGKIDHLENWLRRNPHDLSGCTFYSDSINDLPLLEKVDNPVAVDPDPTLAALARERGWDIISLRDEISQEAGT